MKIVILIIALLIPALSIAQNWQLLNPAYRYNYQSDTSSFISNTILIDSVTIENGDSVFHLNRVARPVLDQWWDYYAVTNLPQFLQRKSVKHSNGFYHFYDTLSFCINPQLELNDTWFFDTANIVMATIVQCEYGTVLGVSDSLKVIVLSSNDTIILSKNYGIVRFPNGFGQNHYYELKGVEGPDIGVKVPGFWEFFDFNVGDQFQYHCGVWAMERSDNLTKRYKILSKTVHGDSIIYGTEYFMSGLYMDTHFSPHQYEFYSEHGFPALVFVNVPFELYNGYNNMFVDVSNYGLSSPYSSYITSSGCIDLNEVIRTYVIQNLKMDTMGLYKDCYKTVFLSNDTSEYYYNCSAERFHISFKPGLGKVTHFIEGFEWFLSESLEGYITNGDTVGTISSIEEIEQKYSLNSLSVYPNPTSDKLNISLQNAWMSAEIIDINGRVVKPITAGREINIADLKQGLYAIRIHTPKGVVTRKFVKE